MSEIGANVKTLKVGDRVCMEPGVPDLSSRASKLGLYNVDPSVVFWATPPVHGVLTPYVVHPAAFTFKLPDNVSFAEAAMVEPFAVGLAGGGEGRIQPGDTAVVTGAGPIGIMAALAALASGCSRVIVSDLVDEKLAIAGRYPGVSTVNVKKPKARRRRQRGDGRLGRGRGVRGERLAARLRGHPVAAPPRRLPRRRSACRSSR